jgi:hypothetical protein
MERSKNNFRLQQKKKESLYSNMPDIKRLPDFMEAEKNRIQRLVLRENYF